MHVITINVRLDQNRVSSSCLTALYAIECLIKRNLKQSHSWVVQETEISQWEVPNFFSKQTFHLNKTFKTWGKSLQLPYANEAKF